MQRDTAKRSAQKTVEAIAKRTAPDPDEPTLAEKRTVMEEHNRKYGYGN